jgi:ACDE family multidrug resistance protein
MNMMNAADMTREEERGTVKVDPPERSLYFDPNLQIVFIITLIVVMGVSTIAPALPEIQAAFGIPKAAVGLLIVVFTLPGVLFAPFFGVLADRYGRKTVLVPSLLLFGIAGSACSLVRDFDLLLALRFLQGIGAASIGSLNLTIIADLFTKRQLATALGYNASILNLAVPSYLIIGGVLASFAWYYPFALPIFAVPVSMLVMVSLRSPEPHSREELRAYLSSAFQSVRNPQVLGLLTLTLFTFMMLYGTYLTYFSLFLGSERFRASPLLIGIITSSMGLTTALTSAHLGTLTLRYSEKKLIRLAFSIYALAFLIVPLVPSIWLFFIPTLLFGLAHGMNLPSIQTLLARLAPLEYRAAFMSLNGMVLRLGQTLGPLIMGLVYVLGGFESIFFLSAGLAAAMIPVAAMIVR